MIPKEISEVLEITADKHKALIVDCVRQSVLVLVESKQPPLAVKFFHDKAGMATPTKGEVYISSVGLNV
jgi:hypothetical protein